VAPDGGVDGAPSFTIASAEEAFGAFKASSPVVSGEEVTLKGENCAASGTTELQDNVYAYAIQGPRLTITTVSNDCADKVAETIRSSRAGPGPGTAGANQPGASVRRAGSPLRGGHATGVRVRLRDRQALLAQDLQVRLQRFRHPLLGFLTARPEREYAVHVR
jgi:hypothetical protein